MPPLVPRQPASTPATVSDITVLTLNCWGLKHLSALRRERVVEVGRRLAALARGDGPSPGPRPSPGPVNGDCRVDVVALQECWCAEDVAELAAATAEELPYVHRFRSGVWGAGLAVLSRWPVTSTEMTPYALNGRPTAFWRGDWYVGKGVGRVTLQVGPGDDANVQVELLVTHTHASYGADDYLMHRLAQSWAIGKRIRAAAAPVADGRHHICIAAGDFNMTPGSLPYHLLQLAATPLTLHDAWSDLHPDAALGPSPSASAHDSLHVHGATSDNVSNTWRWPAAIRKRLHAWHTRALKHAANGENGQPIALPAEFVIDPDTPDPRAKRLDYVFFATSPHAPAWSTKHVAVALTEPHPQLGCSLSDHYAVLATLTPSSSSSSPSSSPAHPLPPDPSPTHILDSVLAETANYRVRERTQLFWRAAHFFAALAIAIACHIAVWFVPRRFGAFLLMLLSTLSLAAGLIDGLLALLFFGSEIRALDEFTSEIQTARAALDPSPPLADDKS